MAKQNNLLKWIMNIATVVLTVLLIGFIALPHIEGFLLGESVGTQSGYDCISFGDGDPKGVATVLLLLVIFACLLALTAILKILADTGVVKSAKFAKVVNIVLVVLSVITAILAIVNIITVATYCNDNYAAVAGKDNGLVACFGTLIVNAIIACVTIATSVVSIKK